MKTNELAKMVKIIRDNLQTRFDFLKREGRALVSVDDLWVTDIINAALINEHRPGGAFTEYLSQPEEDRIKDRTDEAFRADSLDVEKLAEDCLEDVIDSLSVHSVCDARQAEALKDIAEAIRRATRLTAQQKEEK